MVFAASQRAKRFPFAASLGCRGPIRLFSANPEPSRCSRYRLHQSQLAAGNNAVSSGGITRRLPVQARLAKLAAKQNDKMGRKRCWLVHDISLPLQPLLPPH
jgi:hypothetical protein